MDVIRVPPTPALRRWSEASGFAPELVARWGEFYPDLSALLEAMKRPASTFLRLNPLRGAPSETERRLREKGFELAPSGVPGTLRVVQAPFSPGATHEYLMGRYILQDASSPLAPLALEPKPGELVGDLCAAPGGKTILLAGLMQDRGALYAFDANADRIQSLVSNLQRCGVTSAAVYAAPAEAAEGLGLQFDRLLLDAPCTGEGVVSRDPGRRRGQLQEYTACAQQQAELLTLAHRLLRPGGVLVYSTCTLAPEENEFQVQFALQELHFEMEPLPQAVASLKPGGHALVPGLTEVAGRSLDPRVATAVHVLPHLHGTLGFFVARLRKGAA